MEPRPKLLIYRSL